MSPYGITRLQWVNVLNNASSAKSYPVLYNKTNLRNLIAATGPVMLFDPCDHEIGQMTLKKNVECRYNMAQFITILYMALRWQQQKVNQTSNSQQTPHTSPSRASYGVSIMRIVEKIDCIITALHFNGAPVLCCTNQRTFFSTPRVTVSNASQWSLSWGLVIMNHKVNSTHLKSGHSGWWWWWQRWWWSAITASHVAHVLTCSGHRRSWYGTIHNVQSFGELRWKGHRIISHSMQHEKRWS